MKFKTKYWLLIKKEQFVQYKQPLIYMFGDSKRATFPKSAVLVSYSEWQNEGIAKVIK